MFYTIDTETRGLFGGIFAAGVYSGSDYTEYLNEVPRRLWNYLADLPPRTEKGKISAAGSYVYIHNLEFDLGKLFASDPKYMQAVDWDHVLIIRSKIVRAPLKIEGKKYVLKDSYSILPGSLDNLSKSFAVPHFKLTDELDHYIDHGLYGDKTTFFKHVPPADRTLREYLRADCISLHEVIEQLIYFSGLEEAKFHQYVVTAANLSMMTFKHGFRADYEKLCSGRIRKQDEADLRQAYYGGRCEVIKNHLVDGFKYDVNSLYPYIMKTTEMPVGNCQRIEGEEAENYFATLTERDYGLVFVHATVSVPAETYLPVLPVRYNDKLLFLTGSFSGWWLWDELHFAIQRGTVVDQVREIITFHRTAPIFRGYIAKCEHEKINSTGAKREVYKMFQNALSGKTGQRREKVSIKRDTPERRAELDKAKIEYANIYITGEISCLEWIDRSIHSPYIKPQVVATITARARLILYQGMEWVLQNGGHVYYFDTDSLAVDIPLPDGMVNDTEYGKYKSEGVIEEAVYLFPKVYAEKKTIGEMKKVGVKMKGVPKRQTPNRMEWYLQVLADLAKYAQKPDLIMREIYQDDERYKIMTALKARIAFDRPRQVTKGLALNGPTKREMDYQANDSKPLCLDIEALEGLDSAARGYEEILKMKPLTKLYPSLQPYFTYEAGRLLDELKACVRGERWPVIGEDGYIETWDGQKAFYSESLDRIKDVTGAGPKEVKEILELIVAGKLTRRHTRGKLVELIIDDNLTYGTTTLEGYTQPPDQDYMTAKVIAERRGI